MGQQESVSEYVPLSGQEPPKLVTSSESGKKTFLDELNEVTQRVKMEKEEARKCFIAQHLTEVNITQEMITKSKNLLLHEANRGFNKYQGSITTILNEREESEKHNCLSEYKKWGNTILTKFVEEFTLETKLTYCKKTNCYCPCNIHIYPEDHLIQITW